MTTIQIKRGLEANRSSITPAAGELIYTTDAKQVFVGDGSTAGGNQVGGGGGAVLEATASGALANGDLVVVNSDGTVSVVAETSVSEALGSSTGFSGSNRAYYLYSAYDEANERVIIMYSDVDAGDYGTAVVGTVSGSSISFGTPVVFASFAVNGNPTTGAAVVYNSTEQKVVLLYYNSSSYAVYAIVGAVSGTSISFGTQVSLGVSAYSLTGTYDSVNNKIVIAYASTADYYGRARVGTISGTSISFGAITVFASYVTQYYSCVFDPDQGKVVIAYQDYNTTELCRFIVGTVSGTNISFGSTSYIGNPSQITYSEYSSLVYDSANQKVVAIVRKRTSPTTCYAVVGTLSGTTMTWGSLTVMDAGAEYVSATYHAASGKIVVGYRNKATDYDVKIRYGTVSGNSISFGATNLVVNNNFATYPTVCYDSVNGYAIIAYRDTAGAPSKAATYTPPYTSTNLTATNFIGISDGAYADTATATIQIATAVDDAQTGLTAGSQYYVQTDGTLSTTAGTPSVLAGTAISSTEIIIKG